MYLVPIVLFALAVSADGFGVGMAYGIKRIRIPLSSLLVICLASMTAVSLSMLVGHGIAVYFDPVIASRIGAVALIAVGLWFISDVWRSREENEDSKENQAIATLRIKPLGIIIQILREPSRADFDASGAISYREALFLGIALALDALGAGMGASLAGFKIITTVLMVGACKFILVSLGLWLGSKLEGDFVRKYSTLVSGLILCLLGLHGIR
ncbi:MAG: sporulation membrane protein YtaF [Ignavibacteriales bacterium]